MSDSGSIGVSQSLPPEAKKEAEDNVPISRRQYPYAHYEPIEKPSNHPLAPVIHAFNFWSNRAHAFQKTNRPFIPKENYMSDSGSIRVSQSLPPKAKKEAEDNVPISRRQYPYVHYEPIEKPSNHPLAPVIHAFNFWSNRAETIDLNLWHNLKTGDSVFGAAWGKLNLTAKAITEGGFEAFFKHLFMADPVEKLQKTFAFYLSTSTGTVAGALYLSTRRVAFCTDRSLCFTAPSGQEAWIYYKVMIPIVNISAVNPVVMKENPEEKYLQIETTDGHDFWFMGFVNFEKALQHLLTSVTETRAAEFTAHQ